MINVKELTDDQLTQHVAKLSRSMSMYNAAEGPAWSEERVQRERCRENLTCVQRELAARCLPYPPDDYLL